MSTRSNLLGKVVVITGASSGIGRATALAYAREGARVVLAARGRDALDLVAAECQSSGTEALVVSTDVTDADAVHTLAAAAIAEFGRIDVWINNVGIGVVGAYDSVPMAAHRRVIESNLLGHMHGAHAVVPHFRSQRSGILINMISVGGFVPTPYSAAYAASKFGLRAFSEALRAELSDLPDVHVCEVYPGFVDTPGLSHGANYTGRQIKPSPPILPTERVAETMLSLGKRPRASTCMGSIVWPGRLAHAVAPDVTLAVTKRMMDAAFERADPAPITDGNLFEPSRGHSIDGGYRSQGGLSPALVLGGVALLLWGVRAGTRS